MTKAVDLLREIKRMREQWGLTQRDVAELAQVSLRAVQNAEATQKPAISIRAVCQIADALGCDIEVQFRSRRKRK